MRDEIIGLTVRLHGEDRRKLEELTEKTGLSRAELIRKLIREEKLKERKSIDLMLMRRDVDMMTGLLRASLSPVNLKGRASDEDIKRIEMLMTEIRDKISGWEDLWSTQR